jgi:uncharacterized protein (TIGR02996 family)
MSMNQHDAFLQDICENTEDHGPRLVFADWLDEHGDADRAEFIRLQCELTRLSPAEPRHAALQARGRALLAAHHRRWVGDLEDLTQGGEYGRHLAVLHLDHNRVSPETRSLLEQSPLGAVARFGK